MSQELWSDVDRYLTEAMHEPDPTLDAAVADSEKGGLPPIQVSVNQGKLLHLIACTVEPMRILEVGTLGGYSTIWLARALAPGGRLVTLEIDPHHAEVARANLERAGVGDVVDVRVGPGIETLPLLEAEGGGPIDFAFIDADKQSNADYFDWAVKLGRPGTVIIVDNVVRNGAVADPSVTDTAVLGVRRLFDLIHNDPRVTATGIQTVGTKGYDGFVMAIVN